MRRLMVVGNWKMHCTITEALQLVMGLNSSYARTAGVAAEVVVCPPFTALTDVSRFLAQTGIKLGAQNFFYEQQGAYTGEVSLVMLSDLNCDYVLVGHSERRLIFKEDNQMVGKKLRAALQNGFKPILCVGETLEQRQGGETESLIKEQLETALQDVPQEAIDNLVIAYEPVWAIGTGQNATPSQANEVCGFIRKQLSVILGKNAGDQISILYGGSVKPDNIEELIAQPELDGVLVGGASLNVQDFISIIKAVK
jgi:triosephosphate isomerase